MATKKTKKAGSAKNANNQKIINLAPHIEEGINEFMTTNQGLKINDDQNSLKAGDRGATLLEDFILREKITHFDHERIPERVVHARGAGAHGVFQVYESMSAITKANFLQDPSGRDACICPVFYSTANRTLRKITWLMLFHLS